MWERVVPVISVSSFVVIMFENVAFVEASLFFGIHYVGTLCMICALK